MVKFYAVHVHFNQDGARKNGRNIYVKELVMRNHEIVDIDSRTV